MTNELYKIKGSLSNIEVAKENTTICTAWLIYNQYFYFKKDNQT